MKLIEKIEKGLSCAVSGDNGDLMLYEALFDNYLSEDTDYDIVLEKVNSLIDFYNNAENKEEVAEMEVEDILKKL